MVNENINASYVHAFFFLPPKKFEVQCTISNHDLYLQLTAMVSSDTYRIVMEEQTSRSQ